MMPSSRSNALLFRRCLLHPLRTSTLIYRCTCLDSIYSHTEEDWHIYIYIYVLITEVALLWRVSPPLPAKLRTYVRLCRSASTGTRAKSTKREHGALICGAPKPARLIPTVSSALDNPPKSYWLALYCCKLRHELNRSQAAGPEAEQACACRGSLLQPFASSRGGGVEPSRLTRAQLSSTLNSMAWNANAIDSNETKAGWTLCMVLHWCSFFAFLLRLSFALSA